jgi:hypothetical protein
MDKKDRQFLSELFRMFARKLDTSFQLLHEKLNTIMTKQTDFAASLALLKPAIDQVKSDFETYKSAAQAAGVDLSTEETALQDSLDELSDLHTEVSGGTATSSTDATATDTTSDPSTDGTSASTGS